MSRSPLLRILSPIAILAVGGALFAGTPAWSQPRPKAPAAAAAKPKPVTQADIERLERKIAEQQRMLERLVRLQQQYLQQLVALVPDSGTAGVPPPPPPDLVAKAEPRVEPRPTAPRTDAQIETAPPKAETRPVAKPDPKKPTEKTPAAGSGKKTGKGQLVGKVKGGGAEAFVYIADIVASTQGTASMKQEGKQFVPRVLAVQKGTRVEFPNLDAVFHNVFSVTPDNSFDLGSYRQGESKSVTMTKPGVVSVYCNMHPQMVGHILVLPSSLYTRAGADGFYRLANVPAGKHKVVAWSPNSKPVSMEVDVVEDEVTTVELEVKRGREAPHLNKDGMPYGSYKE
jgi:plastocyanin